MGQKLKSGFQTTLYVPNHKKRDWAAMEAYAKKTGQSTSTIILELVTEAFGGKDSDNG